MRMRMKSNLGMVAVLTVLGFALSACTIPDIKFPKPELSGVENFGETNDPVISEMRKMGIVSDTEFVPPLLRLIEVGSSCKGCDKLREPITDSLKGSHLLYVEILKTENAVYRSLPSTEKDKRIATAAKELIAALKVIVALTLESLADADAYMRSSEEWNLSQLSKKNDASLQKTSRRLEKAKHQTLEAKTKFLASLN